MSRIGLTGTPAPSTIFTPAVPPAVETSSLLADILVESLFETETVLAPLLDTDTTLN